MRGSIIRALALEVGDILKADGVEEDADPDSMSERVSPERERKIATEIREVIEGMYVDDDERDMMKTTEKQVELCLFTLAQSRLHFNNNSTLICTTGTP